jgi:hypothetical protein
MLKTQAPVDPLTALLRRGAREATSGVLRKWFANLQKGDRAASDPPPRHGRRKQKKRIPKVSK